MSARNTLDSAARLSPAAGDVAAPVSVTPPDAAGTAGLVPPARPATSTSPAAGIHRSDAAAGDPSSSRQEPTHAPDGTRTSFPATPPSAGDGTGNGTTPAGAASYADAAVPAGSSPVAAAVPGGRARTRTGNRPGGAAPLLGAPPGRGITAMAAAMSEDRGPDSLDAHVRRYLKDLGLMGYHTHDSRRSQGGYPDWTITGNRTIFRELKTQRGKVSTAQREWIAALTAAGDDADVWRPMDLLTGRIARELAAISRLAGAVAWTA